MISSKALENQVVKVYKNTEAKYNFPAIRSVKDAMTNAAPCLVSMKAKNPEMADNVLKLMVAKTARAFNIARNIEPIQVVDTVETIQQEFYYLKLSEVFYVLKQAKMGYFGKTYERIDEPTIIGWFQSYAEERMQMAESESLQKHDQHTYAEKDRKYDGFISKLHAEQSNKEETRIKNLAFAMAKKMAVTEVLRSDAVIIPQLAAGEEKPKEKPKKKKQDK